MKYDKTIVEALVSGAGEDEARAWLDAGEGDPASWNPTLAGSAIEAASRFAIGLLPSGRLVHHAALDETGRSPTKRLPEKQPWPHNGRMLRP